MYAELVKDVLSLSLNMLLGDVLNILLPDLDQLASFQEPLDILEHKVILGDGRGIELQTVIESLLMELPLDALWGHQVLDALPKGWCTAGARLLRGQQRILHGADSPLCLVLGLMELEVPEEILPGDELEGGLR